MSEADWPSGAPPRSESKPRTGWRATADRLLEMLQLRLALLGSEWEAEKLRIFSGVAALLSAVVVALLGLVMLSLSLLWLAPEAWRGWVALALGLALLLLAAWGYRGALRRLSAPSTLFAQSLAELERDRAALKSATEAEGDA